MEPTSGGIELREVAGAELERANALYAELAFRPSSPDRDRTFAGFSAGRIASLGRIVHHADGALEIGGFWVDPALRRRGLAHATVAHVLEALPVGRRVYCLPFVHLADFYRAHGLRDLTGTEELPRSIRAVRTWCSAREGEGLYDPTIVLALDT